MIAPILLVDGPLWPGTAPSKRQRMVSDMAQDLLISDAFRHEGESWRALRATGRYRMFDIMVAIDDARQVAMAEIVAREMADQ